METKAVAPEGVKFLLPAELKRHFLWNGATVLTEQKEKGHKKNLWFGFTIKHAEA